MDKRRVTVIGGGLAGCECAYQLARRGVYVTLYEMKPEKRSAAHHSDMLCELVCSNSLRSNQLSNAVGLLKEELRRLGSLIMEAAYATQVPAGAALAVDRVKFSEYVTEKIQENPYITVINEEKFTINPDEITVVATGPLTSDG
ncbi:MAG: FAD-dependent oxidoreductase, partial [Clostridia bacterium]|nr:FAD-dependent oxidoreductase [Clostridia bacterium]